MVDIRSIIMISSDLCRKFPYVMCVVVYLFLYFISPFKLSIPISTTSYLFYRLFCQSVASAYFHFFGFPNSIIIPCLIASAFFTPFSSQYLFSTDNVSSSSLILNLLDIGFSAKGLPIFATLINVTPRIIITHKI